MTVATQRNSPPEIIGETVGEPPAVSSLARLLLQLHTEPALKLVAKEGEGCRTEPSSTCDPARTGAT